MFEAKRKDGEEKEQPGTTPAETANPPADEKPKKFHKFKYYADCAGWIIELAGIVIDTIKEQPFPKKDDYAY